MQRKGRGFPLEYYPGEILTQDQARENQKIVYLYLSKFPRKATRKVKRLYVYFMFAISISQPLAPCAAVMLPLPTPIHRLHSIDVDTMSTQRNSPRSAPVVCKKPDKVLYTEEQINEFYQIADKLMNGSISMEEAILKLRGGGKFQDISWIIFYIWLWKLQNNHVQGFQQIRPPHQEWMPKGANQRPPHVGGYSRLSLGLGDTNDVFKGLSTTEIKEVYSQIPSLFVEGTNEQVTAWSVVKHAHHGPAFGLNPSKYGLTQGDLNSIAKNGLINHIPPNEQYVQDLQKRWKTVAEHKTVTRLENQTVMGQNCTVFKQMKSGHFVAFKSETGESITGYMLTEKQSNRHDKTAIIGKTYPTK